MKMSSIPLTKLQSEIMYEFYSIIPNKVVYNKRERFLFWEKALTKHEFPEMEDIKNKCPALMHQIEKSFISGKNIQSAIFSECVYAQTLANMLNLNKFINCFENDSFLNELKNC